MTAARPSAWLALQTSVGGNGVVMGRAEWLKLASFLFRYTERARNPFAVDSLMHYWLGLAKPGPEDHFDDRRRRQDTAGRPVLVLRKQQFRHFGVQASASVFAGVDPSYHQRSHLDTAMCAVPSPWLQHLNRPECGATPFYPCDWLK